MKTLDLLNMGIDRNFLRQCENKNLIKPIRKDNDMISHKEYMPREYTHNDVEIVWSAYLCRKIGLSFEDIRKIYDGESVDVREILVDSIKKIENEILELQATLEFAKYVKGVGISIIPTKPNLDFKCKSFKDYIFDYINYLDGDKKINNYNSILSELAEINNIENISQEKANLLENYRKENLENYNQDDIENIMLKILKVKDMTSLQADSQEIQNIITEVCKSYKKINKNEITDGMCAWEWYWLLEESSDRSKIFKNMIGEEGVQILKNGFLEYLTINYPEFLQKIAK